MSITSEELAKTIRRELHFTPTESEALALAAALGIEVADPKPEPGVYMAPIGGEPRPVFVEQDGDLWWINDEGNLVQGMARTVDEIGGLTPARVISEESYEAWQHNLRRMQDERDAWESEYEKATSRVVPAEPVELSEAQVADLWDEHSTSMSGTWRDLAPSERQEQIDLANATLAKYGHGHTTPSRDDVREAVMRGIGQANGSMTQNITTEVMALLEGGKA